MFYIIILNKVSELLVYSSSSAAVTLAIKCERGLWKVKLVFGPFCHLLVGPFDLVGAMFGVVCLIFKLHVNTTDMHIYIINIHLLHFVDFSF